jgi:hypothetical protein
MKSEALGTNTSEVEVTNISNHGLWLLIGDKESFLPFEDFPWFKKASVSAILNVEMLSADHLYWPDLDVDLSVESIEHPERFPLVSDSNQIVIGVGFANLPEGVDGDALRRSLICKGGEFQTYALAPAPPGVIRAGGFDLMLLVSAAGSVASMAALLWTAYEKFIAPRKTSQQDDAGIYIVIRRPDGSTTDFWIGKKERDRDVFIRQFTETVAEIHASDDPSFWREAAAEIQETEIWVVQK